jgi:hypothetical protein
MTGLSLGLVYQNKMGSKKKKKTDDGRFTTWQIHQADGNAIVAQSGRH